MYSGISVSTNLHYFLPAAPYPVRPARPWPYLDFEKEKAAAAAAAHCHYGGLTWLGRARLAGGAPEIDTCVIYINMRCGSQKLNSEKCLLEKKIFISFVNFGTPVTIC